MDWISVNSKMLIAVAYDRHWRQLYLKFRSGDVSAIGKFPRRVGRGCLRPIPQALMCASTF